jgi:hypothetical protein
MRIKYQILILLISLNSCLNSKNKMNKIEEVELGMTVEEVVKILNIKNTDLYIIQEPPLIYRGINATLTDSTDIAISFERTPANPKDISKKTGIKIVSKLKIKGFAWKKKNGESKIIGDHPKFWIE